MAYDTTNGLNNDVDCQRGRPPYLEVDILLTELAGRGAKKTRRANNAKACGKISSRLYL